MFKFLNLTVLSIPLKLAVNKTIQNGLCNFVTVKKKQRYACFSDIAINAK